MTDRTGTIVRMKTTATRLDLKTDFGTLDDEGLVWARTDWFAPGTETVEGNQLVAGDPDDIIWRVTVARIDGVWVGLRLDAPLGRGTSADRPNASARL